MAEPPIRGPAGLHQTVRLARGRHSKPEKGACVMELASMLAGEPFSDRPRSVCRTLAALLRAANDHLGNRARQELYRYAAESVGTAGDPAASRRRLAVCAEAVRDRPQRWLLRLRPIVPPAEPSGPAMEAFVAAVVRSFPRSPAGVAALLALIDDVIAVRTPTAARLEPPTLTPIPT
jgi:hypothetical protein